TKACPVAACGSAATIGNAIVVALDTVAVVIAVRRALVGRRQWRFGRWSWGSGRHLSSSPRHAAPRAFARGFF
ncbi:MAG: hypothetical protein WBL84_21650, partial [Xanthobacteraceae bacterium]